MNIKSVSQIPLCQTNREMDHKEKKTNLWAAGIDPVKFFL